MAKQSASQRRARRDLVPAVLVTGAAGLVVALVVGGTTNGIDAALSRSDAALPVYADSAAASLDAADVSVQVRPSTPTPSAIASLFDDAPPASSSSSKSTSTSAFAPTAARARALTAATADIAVRGFVLDRAEPEPAPATAAEVVPPPSPPAATTVAAASVPEDDAKTRGKGKTRNKNKAKDSAEVTKASGHGPSSAAGDERPPSSGRDEPPKAAATTAEDRPGQAAPPDHAKGHGRRGR